MGQHLGGEGKGKGWGFGGVGGWELGLVRGGCESRKVAEVQRGLYMNTEF